MCDTFYVFETYVPSIYKFGFTTRTLNERLKEYPGVSKPKQVIMDIKTPNGRLLEKFFSCYLDSKHMPIEKTFGVEYFKCDDVETISAFKNMLNIRLMHHDTLGDIIKSRSRQKATRAQVEAILSIV